MEGGPVAKKESLAQLRKQTVEAFARVKETSRHRSWKALSMREAWQKASEDMALLEQIGIPDIDSNLREFHRIGEIYFHAKKHGKASAMMLKLQRA